MSTLLLQFNSDLLTQNEDPAAKQYYDKLYATRRGYYRYGPTWEIPQWIAEMARVEPEADVYFAEDMYDALGQAESYTRVAFSALDCNWKLIQQFARSFSGLVYVGGYVDPDVCSSLDGNIVWCHSIKDYCEIREIEYRPGIDYRHFVGAKTIARLTLSTGCKHHCKFCIVPDAVVCRTGDDIYQQADEICKLNSPLVYINDKTFGQAENCWQMPCLLKYLDRYTHTWFDGFIVQTTASQLLKLDDEFLLRSGIRYVELGVESYNDNILRAMKKPATEELIDQATEKLRRLGIKLIPNIIVGLPGETVTSYSNTILWLYDNLDVISHINVYNLALYDDAELAGEIEHTDADLDETSTGKSYYGGDKQHDAAAQEFYEFGMKALSRG